MLFLAGHVSSSCNYEYEITFGVDHAKLVFANFRQTLSYGSINAQSKSPLAFQNCCSSHPVEMVREHILVQIIFPPRSYFAAQELGTQTKIQRQIGKRS